MEATVDTKDEYIHDFAADRRAAVHSLADRDHVEFIAETARILDDCTLAVDHRVLTPDYLVIVSGSTGKDPDLPGIESVDAMTSADVLDATRLPETGIVMGFGYIGLELVLYLVEAGGMAHTVIQHDARPLDEADPAYGHTLIDRYREQFGIDSRTHAYKDPVEPTDTGGSGSPSTRTVAMNPLMPICCSRSPAAARPSTDLTAHSRDSRPNQDWSVTTMQAGNTPPECSWWDADGHDPILHAANEQDSLASDNIRCEAAGEALVRYENTNHYVVFSGLGVDEIDGTGSDMKASSFTPTSWSGRCNSLLRSNSRSVSFPIAPITRRHPRSPMD